MAWCLCIDYSICSMADVYQCGWFTLLLIQFPIFECTLTIGRIFSYGHPLITITSAREWHYWFCGHLATYVSVAICCVICWTCHCDNWRTDHLLIMSLWPITVWHSGMSQWSSDVSTATDHTCGQEGNVHQVKELGRMSPFCFQIIYISLSIIYSKPLNVTYQE